MSRTRRQSDYQGLQLHPSMVRRPLPERELLALPWNRRRAIVRDWDDMTVQERREWLRMGGVE